MLIEYEAVLSRPVHLAATGLTLGEVGSVLDALGVLVVPVTPHFLWRPQLRDPNDAMVLEAAVNAGAECIARSNIAMERPGDILRRLP